MFKPVNDNRLPNLKAGDVLFAQFKCSVATTLDYLLSAWILPRVYLHVGFVIRDCAREELDDDPYIIFDAVKRRINPSDRRHKVTLRSPQAFLRNMNVLGIGRIENLQIKPDSYKKLENIVVELSKRDTDYSMIYYKCPHANPPSFSCYGLVEYCYELLGFDLVADDKYIGKRWFGLPGIPCFRPEHQRQAFEEERYAFKHKSVI
jgi:hypothetical protein